jgi:hypothetical protein
MPKIVITHSVVDVNNWLKFKAERAEIIVATLGGANVADFVAEDGSNAVAVTGEVPDPAALMATIASPPPELGAAMERHGVVPPLTLYVEK